MKHNGSYLRQYLPWLVLLLGVDALAALLLWLADARAFAATAGVIVLATVFLFACVCAVLCARAKKREQAFSAFLHTPDTAHEQALCRLLAPSEAQSVRLLGETLRAQQQTIVPLQTQMDDYEDYVELWAHEVKTPLALLTLVLDNRRGTLPEAVAFMRDDENGLLTVEEAIEELDDWYYDYGRTIDDYDIYDSDRLDEEDLTQLEWALDVRIDDNLVVACDVTYASGADEDFYFEFVQVSGKWYLLFVMD